MDKLPTDEELDKVLKLSYNYYPYITYDKTYGLYVYLQPTNYDKTGNWKEDLSCRVAYVPLSNSNSNRLELNSVKIDLKRRIDSSLKEKKTLYSDVETDDTIEIEDNISN